MVNTCLSQPSLTAFKKSQYKQSHADGNLDTQHFSAVNFPAFCTYMVHQSWFQTKLPTMQVKFATEFSKKPW
jgi:hypothetical protein